MSVASSYCPPPPPPPFDQNLPEHTEQQYSGGAHVEPIIGNVFAPRAHCSEIPPHATSAVKLLPLYNGPPSPRGALPITLGAIYTILLIHRPPY